MPNLAVRFLDHAFSLYLPPQSHARPIRGAPSFGQHVAKAGGERRVRVREKPLEYLSSSLMGYLFEWGVCACRAPAATVHAHSDRPRCSNVLVETYLSRGADLPTGESALRSTALCRVPVVGKAIEISLNPPFRRISAAITSTGAGRENRDSLTATASDGGGGGDFRACDRDRDRDC